MDFHLFTELFNTIDATTATFANDVSSRAIISATPFITAALTLSFIFYDLLVARGTIEASLQDFFWRSLKIGIIVSIATAGGLYQSEIVTAIQKTPDELAASLVPNSSQNATAAAAIDQAAGQGFQKASEALENSGVFTKQAIAYGLVGFLLFIGTLLFTAIGGAFLLLAKISLALLAAIGPFFIFSLIFKSTSKFFEQWVNQCVNYGLLVVFATMIFGFLLNIFMNYMSQFTFDGNFNLVGSVAGCVVIAVVCLYILIQLPSFAAGLAGGAVLGLWNEMGIASSIGSKSAAAGKASGRAAAATGKAAYGGGKAVAGGVSKAVGRFRGSARAA